MAHGRNMNCQMVVLLKRENKTDRSIEVLLARLSTQPYLSEELHLDLGATALH